jgi:hypothetical protein
MQTNSTKINLYLKSFILTDTYRRTRLDRVMRSLDTTKDQIGGLVPIQNTDALAWFIASQSRFIVSDQIYMGRGPSIYAP